MEFQKTYVCYCELDSFSVLDFDKISDGSNECDTLKLCSESVNIQKNFVTQ